MSGSAGGRRTRSVLVCSAHLLVALAETGGAGSTSGNVLVVLGSLAAAAYAVAARRLALGVDPLGLVFRQGVAAVVLTLPYVVWSWSTEGSRIPSASVRTLGLAGLAGLVGFAIPFVLWAYAAPHVRANVAGVAINVIPVVGVLTAAVVGLGAPTLGQPRRSAHPQRRAAAVCCGGRRTRSTSRGGVGAIKFAFATLRCP